MNYLPYPVTKISASPAAAEDKARVDQKIVDNRQQLNEVMGILRHNISLMSERSERLEKLASRAEVLDMAACGYQKTAHQVCESRRKKLLPQLVVAVLIVACVVSGIGYACLSAAEAVSPHIDTL